MVTERAAHRLDRHQLTPIDYPGLVRLGLPRDGGYVVPAALVEQSSLLLSLGINQDWSFERDFVARNRNARVIGVDGSIGPRLFVRQIAGSLRSLVRSVPARDRKRTQRQLAVLRTSFDYFRFFSGRHRHLARMVGGATDGSEITVAGLLAMDATAGDHRVFLKMDIEGAEYAAIGDIVRGAARINCVVAEFHRVTRKVAAFNEAIGLLREQFRVVHVHGNNYAAYDQEQAFPDAVEITMVNRALCPEPTRPSLRAYPSPGLDYPNLPTKPDYALRFD